MNDASSALEDNAPEDGTLFQKYASLIHILNGEEEFVLDQNGFIIGSNLEAVNVTGYEEYEIMGKHISMFYRQDERDKAIADLAKAARLGNAVVTGLRVKKRGVHFWAKMRIKLITLAPYEGPNFKVILQDATHRALSKERIRTLKDEYLAIFNNPFVGTFKVNMNGFGIQMCNQKTLDILGRQHSTDLRFDTCFSSVERFEQFVAQLKEEGRIEGFKFLVQGADEQLGKWALVSARYFESQGFAEGVIFDISDQHRQFQELERVNAELDNFIYHASHDLRSPLTSIMGLINLGMRETSVETIHSYLRMMGGRIDHLDILLKDLIAVSYNNEMAKEYENFNLEEEIGSMLKLLENPAQTFKVDVNVKQRIEFRTDPVRLRTILRNLLSNAFKYYNPEVAVPSIQLTVRVAQSHCAILLRDNGIGIRQEFKSKVYDMFFRATERSSGSGLGLYIVKSMVDKLQGRISFESTLNVGTTFLLSIPNHAIQSIPETDYSHYMLTSKQIELVETSWDYILLHAPEAGVIFYKKLFELDPGLKQLFKGDIDTQSQKLVAMITFAVHKLNNLEEILFDVKELGAKHHLHHVRPEHYETVATALLWTLERALANQWNPAVKDAWASVYATLSKTMIGASQKSVL